MLVIADRWGMDLVVIQQLSGVAGIFGCDQPDLPEDPQGSLADVLQVTNWCSDEEKGAHQD